MSTPTFDKFNVVSCIVNFTADGVLTDPTAPLFSYRDWTGTWTEGLPMTRVSTGVWQYELSNASPDEQTILEQWVGRGYTLPNDATLPNVSVQGKFQTQNIGQL